MAGCERGRPCACGWLGVIVRARARVVGGCERARPCACAVSVCGRARLSGCERARLCVWMV